MRSPLAPLKRGRALDRNLHKGLAGERCGSRRGQRSGIIEPFPTAAWFLFQGVFAVHLDLRLAEKAIPHAFLVRIPVPVILVGLLFDAPKLIEQSRVGNGELETVAHDGVGPL